MEAACVDRACPVAIHEYKGKNTSTKVSLNKTRLTLLPKKSAQLVLNNASEKKVTWKSSDPSIVSVTKSGKVTAKKPGKTTVTATYRKKTYICKITVKEEEIMIYAHIGKDILQIKPESNSSAEALIDRLKQGDITVEMNDYGGFEKVGSLGMTLPRNDKEITTKAGDVILYNGNQITIYYDTNTWDFTLLGRVQGVDQKELKDILGKGSITAVFSLK